MICKECKEVVYPAYNKDNIQIGAYSQVVLCKRHKQQKDMIMHTLRKMNL